ncbi:hypothetical protein J4G37_61505, partial [Microvirga sp. 3-52]|nr:hypothetical protein [Microvirga sp. 3-52]
VKQKANHAKALDGASGNSEYANESGIIDYEIDSRDIAFNREGSTESAQITFTLEDYFGIHWIEVFDYLNPEGGTYGDGYLGYIYADYEIDPGSYKLD